MAELVSVIVPVYNVEKYLDRCVESIVRQTYSNLEIILVDDGSPDNCPAMCDEWAKKDKRVKVIHQKNAGVSVARNVGMRIAEGEYWMFVDSDDYLAKNSVLALYQRILKDGSQLAIGSSVYVCQSENGVFEIDYGALKDEVLTQEEAFSRMGIDDNFKCELWAKLYSRKIMETISLPQITCGEDLWVWPDIISGCAKISTVAEGVYYYVQQSNSIMSTLDDSKLFEWITVDCRLARLMLNKNLFHNASNYFTGAVHRLCSMREYEIALKVVKSSFEPKERFCLLRKDIHSLLRYGALYFPVLKWLLDWRRRRRGLRCS